MSQQFFLWVQTPKNSKWGPAHSCSKHSGHKVEATPVSMITGWTFKMGPAMQLNGTQPLSTSTRFQAVVAEAEAGWWNERPACPLPRVWGKCLELAKPLAPGSICVPWKGSSFQSALAEWPCIPLPTSRFVCHASRFLKPSRFPPFISH